MEKKLRKDVVLEEKLNKFLATMPIMKKNQRGDKGLKEQQTRKVSVCVTEIAQTKLLKTMYLTDTQIKIKYWERFQ